MDLGFSGFLEYPGDDITFLTQGFMTIGAISLDSHGPIFIITMRAAEDMHHTVRVTRVKMRIDIFSFLQGGFA
jgi:hypothetical protein